MLETFFAFIFGIFSREPQAIILFNKNPITINNVLENATEFQTDKRIYYVFMSKKEIQPNVIRVKVYKRDAKARHQITKLAYSNDFKLNAGEVYYFSDYIIMHDGGEYCMMVYSKERLDKPLAMADFIVN